MVHESENEIYPLEDILYGNEPGILQYPSLDNLGDMLDEYINSEMVDITDSDFSDNPIEIFDTLSDIDGFSDLLQASEINSTDSSEYDLEDHQSVQYIGQGSALDETSEETPHYSIVWDDLDNFHDVIPPAGPFHLALDGSNEFDLIDYFSDIESFESDDYLERGESPDFEESDDFAWMMGDSDLVSNDQDEGDNLLAGIPQDSASEAESLMELRMLVGDSWFVLQNPDVTESDDESSYSDESNFIYDFQSDRCMFL